MHPNDGRVVSNFIVSALSNQPLTVYGEGEQTRSFCFVDDLIDGLVAMMQTDDSVTGPLNLGNPGEFTIRELADLVLSETGSNSTIAFLPLPPDDPTRRQPVIDAAKEILGWEPTTDLETGLRKTIDYFRREMPDASRT
jgi:UDP-glucuronate decarboxylase